jgi:hypothetical protein
VRHNPPPYFTTLAECATKDVPYAQFGTDLATGSLPAFSFITPNLIDDMHDGTIAQGDEWLKANVPAILSSSEYTSGTLALFITWDEGEGGTSSECATNTIDVGCHVATIVVSPSTAADAQSSTLLNHYFAARKHRAAVWRRPSRRSDRREQHDRAVQPLAVLSPNR